MPSRSGRPLCIDLFCGLGGWSEGFIAEGWDVVGFDIERHKYGESEYPGDLVLQDVLTIHGSQFKNTDCIVASPPCQEYSAMAMPFSRGKKIARALWLGDESGFPPKYKGSRDIWELNRLFDACFRIQHEACVAAGRYIPLVVENVRGAQPWIGKSKHKYGSFHLWGDVPALMPKAEHVKCTVDLNWNRKNGKPPLGFNTSTDALVHGRKVPGLNFHEHEKTGKPGRSFQSAAVEHRKQPIWFNDDKRRGEKCGGDWLGPGKDCSLMRSMGSKSSARKRAAAEIAKIPLALSLAIARAYKPT